MPGKRVFEGETDQYHFLKPIPIFEVKFWRNIWSQISADNIGVQIYRSVSYI